jgi:hypothetical protein
MTPHPVFLSRARSLSVLLVGLTAAAAYWACLTVVVGQPPLTAMLHSLLSIGLLCAMGFAFWYVCVLLRSLSACLLLSIPMWLLWLGVTHVFDPTWSPLLVRGVLGLCLWGLLLLWYRIEDLAAWRAERLAQEATRLPMEAVVERITVKSGSRIQVIRVEDLHYIQACGDYVMLHTTSGEHLKEQTMKAFETHLPQHFVRIHRSYIVNAEQIARMELYGKESYDIHLKSGAVLRASASGYKALKQVLGL